MIFLAFVLFGMWAVFSAAMLLGTWLSLKYFRFPRRPAQPASLPPVTILKPLKGLDEGLEENLETFFQLDYPQYEVLFSVADPEDPARKVVERLQQRYPRAHTRLLIGDIPLGPNPKINNLLKGYELARHDWILISDSNARVKADYLKRLMEYHDDSVGIVTAMVTGLEPQGWGGHLEAAYLNTFYTRWMKLCFALGHPTVMGKSMLFRKSLAERFGGLKVLGPYLAEDYMSGLAVRRLGYRIVLMREPIGQFLGRYTVKDFWLRHLRWGRMRKSQAPVAFFFEPAMGMVGSAILGACALKWLFGISWVYFFPLHFFLWALCDLLLMKKVGAGFYFASPFTWLCRELLAFPLWLHTALGDVVFWRGRHYKLLPGGMIDPNYHDPQEIRSYMPKVNFF